jgi:aquaporin Z
VVVVAERPSPEPGAASEPEPGTTFKSASEPARRPASEPDERTAHQPAHLPASEERLRRAEITRLRDALLTLESPDRADMDDPSLEWRRLFSEMLGTFLLVMAGAGAGVVTAVSHGQISRTAAVTAPGLTVMAVILFMGAISGAHLNPVVTLAFGLRRDFPWKRAFGYIVVQLIGATLACLFLWAVFGKVGQLGATVPGPGIADWQAMLIELVLTAGLVSTILGTSSSAQNVGALSALGVGGYIVLAGLWSSPISGASMNPARSFGPDLVLGDFKHYWVYIVGPLAGTLIAVGIAYILRGPGGRDPGGEAAGSGRLMAPGQAGH